MKRLFLVLCGLAAVSAGAGCNSKAREADGGGGTSGGAGGAGGGTGAVGNPDGGAGGGGGARGGAGGTTAGANARGGAGGAAGSGGSGPACAFAYTYTVTEWSGPDTDSLLRLSPPDSFHYMGETPFLNDAGVVTRPSCDPAMPACNDPARIDVSDIEAALANADVQAALAATTPIKCGTGPAGLSSFPLFSFSGSDSRGFSCGPDCATPSSTCTPIPPGIKAFIDLVHALETQQLASDPSCQGVH
jgi:hypothetical protein